ncbi:ribosome small subunit-dependent GTPase A [Desulfovibrio aerotolerans]|uniref:Small ribosomal subunit biogenesis GTPase RsgA n=1 Tax=Solidesulfovibrio aerotolerans TaxID=295255 RepID=A0A7C9MFB6_9BACT|nr:ribosome small subunit-dependent GTPase A [Solidesulfovibrio aerotolerans]MYL83330.1 ribosome small subunit-dependent GTPase A [Solidesulfovibrio aerotolerans]
MELHNLGFDHWFERQLPTSLQKGCGVARVCAVDRGIYRVRNGSGEIPAELAGRLAYTLKSPDELPCAGDWVIVSYYNDDAAALIQQVLPRKSFLRRRSPGDSRAIQMIAANIDTAFLVQSCHFDFNPNRLDRYLAMAADGGVTPVVVLTKTDLIDREDLEQKIALVAAMTTAEVIALSTVTGTGWEALGPHLVAGQTACLLGSSGVGKTTLINRLVGRKAFETRAVSGTGEGTHTTTRRQLVVCSQGALVIDTPGMRELGLADAGEGIEAGFEDIAALAARCRYADCSHGGEPGCAVAAALQNGELAAQRYANYCKLKKESAYYALSSLDKRKKDKAFGRLVKAVKKRKDR